LENPVVAHFKKLSCISLEVPMKKKRQSEQGFPGSERPVFELGTAGVQFRGSTVYAKSLKS
jgi:hypothetical protein